MLLQLPTELKLNIFDYLLGQDLLNVSSTCHELYDIIEVNDSLWRSVVQHHVGDAKSLSLGSFPTWKKQYLAFHPLWFFVKRPYWFSDYPFKGGFAVMNFSHGTLEILEHRIQRIVQPYVTWARDTGVLIRPCEFEVHSDNIRDLDDTPLLHLKGPIQASQLWNNYFKITRTLPEEAMDPGTNVCPPFIIPASTRTRGYSGNQFDDIGHRPTSISQICENAFRVYREHAMHSAYWHTWSCLDPELVTPTPKYPLRGIWAGDYNGHGSEFIAFLQPEPGTPYSVPEGARTTLESSQERQYQGSDLDLSGHMPSGLEKCELNAPLLAVKLSGDKNVPRGAYTFYTDSLGSSNFLRNATESPFEGARVVRAVCQTAGAMFKRPEYHASQLFIVSSNEIAVYWEHLGHISYFKRLSFP
jgi:hypothetical protein